MDLLFQLLTSPNATGARQPPHLADQKASRPPQQPEVVDEDALKRHELIGRIEEYENYGIPVTPGLNLQSDATATRRLELEQWRMKHALEERELHDNCNTFITLGASLIESGCNTLGIERFKTKSLSSATEQAIKDGKFRSCVSYYSQNLQNSTFMSNPMYGLVSSFAAVAFRNHLRHMGHDSRGNRRDYSSSSGRRRQRSDREHRTRGNQSSSLSGSHHDRGGRSGGGGMASGSSSRRRDSPYQEPFPGVPEEDVRDYNYHRGSVARERNIHFAGGGDDSTQQEEPVSVNYPQPTCYRQGTPRMYESSHQGVMGGPSSAILAESGAFRVVGTDAREIRFPDESTPRQAGGTASAQSGFVNGTNLLTGVLQAVPIISSMSNTANAIHTNHARFSATSIGQVAEGFAM
jgi:hypothetical protein